MMTTDISERIQSLIDELPDGLDLKWSLQNAVDLENNEVRNLWAIGVLTGVTIGLREGQLISDALQEKIDRAREELSDMVAGHTEPLKED